MDGPYQAYVINSAGGRPRKLDDLGTGLLGWTWSRDGKWIFFSSTRSGSADLWKMPADGGQPEQLTHKGAGKPTESPDGKVLYYARSGSVRSVPVEGGEEREIFKADVNQATLEAARRGIYFIVNSSVTKDGELMFFPFPNGPTMKIDGVHGRYGLSLSPDQRRLAYTMMTSTGSDLMLVENFQ